MIDFEYDDIDGALGESVKGLCQSWQARAEATSPVAHDPELWQQLAEMGVLGLATQVGGGSATTVTAVMEQLGYFDAPGPLVETFVAAQLLPDDQVEAVASGQRIATVTTSPLVPWLPLADLVVEIEHDSAYLVTATDIDEFDTLANVPWGRATLQRHTLLGEATRAVAIGDVAAAAYLVGEASQVLAAAAEYARDRVQFKVPIASFQAISHPFADCYVGVTAARALVRQSAYLIDTAGPDATAAAATARRSATRAALDTVLHAHQTYGAMGFTVEGPIGNRSAKVRQVSLAAAPPDSNDRVLAKWGL